MLRAFIILILILACFQKASAQLSNAGLVVYLPLNGTASDASGNNYPVVLNGGSFITDADGNPNSAYYINGNSKITISNLFKLRGSLDEVTILVKVRADTLPHSINWPQAPYYNLQLFDYLSWHRMPAVQNFPGEVRKQFNMSCLSGGSYPGLWPPPYTTAGGVANYHFNLCSPASALGIAYEKDTCKIIRKWHSVAYVFNRSWHKIYYNCEKAWETQASISQFKPCDLDSSLPLQIVLGNLVPPMAGAPLTSYIGGIDEVRIYTRALSEDEIKAYAGNLCRADITPKLHMQSTCDFNRFRITDSSVTNGIPITSRKWIITRDNFILPDSTSFEYIFSRAGNYNLKLELIDAGGCRYYKDTSFAIPFQSPPKLLKSEQDVYYLCGSQRSVQVKITGGNNYQWSPCIDIDVCNHETVTVTPTADRLYTITGTNEIGCADTIRITVKRSNDSAEVFVPSAFTPNNDGVNDVLGIQSSSPPGNFQFEIYNRWGERVFKTSYALATWNGTFNYKKQPVGTYLWKLQYSGGPNCPVTRKKGTVVLIR